MAGYPQPPYGGMPYPHAHSQMPPGLPGLTPQSPVAPEGDRSHFQYNAHMSSEQDALLQAINTGYQYNGGLPGLNMQSFNQNVPPPQPSYWQQPPPPQPQSAYAAPSFPAPHFNQNGFSMPPPPPPVPSPALFAALAQHHAAQNVQIAPVTTAPAPSQVIHPQQPVHAPQPRSLVTPRTRFTELTESDKEDGEVSEVDHYSPAPGKPAKPFAPSTAPRSIPQGPRGTRLVSVNLPPKPPAQSNQGSGQNQQVGATPSIQKLAEQQSPESAKAFIRTVHAAGYSYDALVSAGLSAPWLRTYYQSLQLPLPSDPTPVPHPAALTHPLPKKPSQIAPSLSATNDKPAPVKPITSVKINRNHAPSAAATASPVDRKDYIARLQALKKNPGATTKATSTRDVSPAAASPSSFVIDNTHQAVIQNAVREEQSSEEIRAQQKTRQTEILRQKLEALKMKTKQPQSPAPAGSAPQKPYQSSNPSSATVQPTLPTENNHSPLQTRTPSSSGIPGLFMSSSTVSLNEPTQTSSTTSRNVVKAINSRPPAPLAPNQLSTPDSSDPPLEESPSNAQSMVLEVSDDESTGSAMDLEEEQVATHPKTSLQPNRTPWNDHSFAQPFDGFSRSVSGRPTGSAIQTPSAAQSPGMANEELASKERDIALMKMKLQEMELKKKQAKEAIARARTNDGSSPKRLQSIPLKRPNPFGTQPALISNGPEEKISTPQSPAVSDSIEKDSSSEWKKRRRAEIKSGLPTLEAGIATNNARKAQLLKELEELEAHNRRVLQDKQNLVQELERLGIDTEGASHAELQAKKDEIDHQKDLDAQNAQEVTVAPTVPSSDMTMNETSKDNNTGTLEGGFKLPGLSTVLSAGNVGTKQSSSKEPSSLVESIKDVHGPPPPTEPRAMGAVAKAATLDSIGRSRESSQLNPPAESVGHGKTPPPTKEVSTENTANQVIIQEAPSPGDEANFYSPDSNINAMLTEEGQGKTVTEEAKQDQGDHSQSGDSDMEMSQSITQDEMEYEPEEPHLDIPKPIKPTTRSDAEDALKPPLVSPPLDEQEEYEPEEQAAQVVPSPPVLLSSPLIAENSEDDGEIYEPPDVEEHKADAPLDVTSQIPIIEPEMETGATDDDDQGAMDISSSSDDSDTDTDSDSDSDSDEQSLSDQINQAKSLSISNHPAEVAFPIADHLAPELPSEPSTVPQPSATTKLSAGFTPYQSPLQMFKSYRYSPRFLQEVAGGYQSITYSHNIDANTPLCQWEGAGGKCLDPSCPGQHFRDMGISGDKILVQLGTANPGKTPEEKKEWNDGLRLVLKELRQKNIKDPNGIAQEIAKFRREFLKDDTRVVNL